MQALFFERPLLLIGFLGAVQFVLTWVWARRRTRRSSRAALAGLLLFPTLLVVQALVVTDRERIIAVCRDMADAIESSDLPRVRAHVAPTFAAGEMGRDALLAALERVLQRATIEEPRLSGFEVSVEGDRGRAAFGVTCRVVLRSAIESGLVSRWELLFERREGGWQVVEIRPLPTPWFPYRSLGEVLRGSGM